MALRKSSGSLLLFGAATAAVIALTAAPALAASSATTWTIKAGGAFSAKAGTTTLKDTKTGNQLSCTSSTTSGTFKSGSGLSGTGAGSISALSFSNCTGPLGLAFSVTTSHFPWSINLISYASGVSKVTITGIHATLSGPSCTATIDGTSATADNGRVDGTYANSSGDLKVLATGGNLHIYKVSGCAGLLKSGNASTFTGTYKVSPKQTITSP